MRRHLLLFGLLSLALTGCGNTDSIIPGFDGTAWRRDARGCRGERARQLSILDQHRGKLYGLRNGVVNELLGRPDEEELQEQTQRVFYYYVEPGSQCEPGRPRSAARRLVLRIGALGTVTEVLYTTAPPERKPGN
ncbi:hypothetical protein [Hymenobacter sp. B81]|uniref:hypothetical protein n=1 Tax=Hymenobacter sp. B81 TaxID=3344878 RepID=UPI0037DC94EF